jgi:hypothetical protein
LFSIDEITRQMTELLRSYRHYYLNCMDIEDSDEMKDFKEQAKIALDTFRAMFGGRIDNEKFLLDGSEDAVLETLRSWAQSMAPSAISEREIRPTLEDCSALLMQLSSEQISDRQPAVWPYVRKIKYVLPVIRLGVSL